MRLLRELALCAAILLGAESAHATHVHLPVGQLELGQLGQLAALPAALRLTAPCLGCAAARVQPRLLASRPSAQNQQAFNAPSSTPPAPAQSGRMYIGDTWHFAGGRELSLHLTPNEGHCAPLMRLTF